MAAPVALTAQTFGGIDICVNNASAINLAPVSQLPVKAYDLMTSINSRGTFVVSQACLPCLRQGQNPHILTVSPPVSMEPGWISPHAAYVIAKYGMTILAMGPAAELGPDGVASNTLWPRCLVATAAVRNLLGGDEAVERARAVEFHGLNPPGYSVPEPTEHGRPESTRAGTHTCSRQVLEGNLTAAGAPPAAGGRHS